MRFDYVKELKEEMSRLLLADAREDEEKCAWGRLVIGASAGKGAKLSISEDIGG